MSPKPRTTFAPADSRRERGRAQTTLDFAIGMSVFLIAVTFVFSFIPGMLEPFTASNEARTVVADRVADSLAEGMLGDPANPYILDGDCTVAFFDEGASENTDDDGDYEYVGNSLTGCTFADVSMRERLGIAGHGGTPGPRFNVTIESDYNDQDGPSSGTNGYGLPTDDTEETLCVTPDDTDDSSEYWFVDASTDDSRDGGDDCDLSNGDHLLLAAGETPPSSGSVVTARRVVRIEGPTDDIDATIYVKVW